MTASASRFTARSVLSGLRDIFIRFLLPLLILGALLEGIELLLEMFNVHSDMTNWLRTAVMPLYLLIAMLGMRKKK
ncbi:hypothetical protein [Insolitispirillum peregrinum]|uniref:Uncharacterized protein n=1 Tax=Insolitispirillum peregrinum TaxID=80876 RepID=A0A1N7LNS8_9PROT|nr:hypothetical protein [Insolitispirillum peregrinum]SIS75381.1 hypothetical protein SAMN05421779_103447 [Insolitispirillum peregrinum]